MANPSYRSESLPPGNKRIVVCLDGTWNAPEKAAKPGDSGDKDVPTNVLEFVRSVSPRDAEDRHQIIYYDAGVGTHRGIDRLLGGGLGMGLALNVQEAYRFIANNYLAGDHIFILGFSRGAYTARSLGGFVDTVGLLDKRHLGLVADAYALYRLAPKERADSSYKERIENARPTPRRNVPIEFIGVWDTVGALGAPIPWLGPLTQPLVGFHDTTLGDNVRHAYHALAIDERRRPFQPDLWTARGDNTKTLQQVWFPGVHANIGGGYRNQGLSSIALNWMMHRAREHRLAFTPAAQGACLRLTAGRLREKALTGLHADSYSWGYKSLVLAGVRPYTREIGPHQHGDIRKPGADTGDERIHQSALDRFGNLAPFGGIDMLEPYAPENLAAAKNILPVFAYDPPLP